MPETRDDDTVVFIDEVPPTGRKPKLAWSVHERGPGDPPDTFVSHEALLATEEADTFRVYHHVLYEPPSRRGYMSLDVLPQLIGTPWNAGALNLVHALRPSAIRVVDRARGGITLDSRAWRVTVYLGPDDRTIRAILQEVEVGLRGCRYGEDMATYAVGHLPPDGAGNEVLGAFNVKSVAALEIYRDKAETLPEVCPCASVHSDGEPRMGVTREDAADHADPECGSCGGTGLTRNGGTP